VAEGHPSLAGKTRPGTELPWASLLHLWNDGLTAALTVLLPLVAADLHLGYAQVALVRSTHLAALAAAQIPIAALAGAARETAVLGGGLIWFGAAYLALAGAMTLVGAVTWAAIAGVGAGAFHPVATNRIARLADPRSRGRAVGTLNFAGDLGKFLLPAAAGVGATLLGWRRSLGLLGALGVLVGIGYLWIRHNAHAERVGEGGAPPGRRGTGAPEESGRATVAGWGIVRPWPFALITAIGVIDNGIRSATLTFLPFLLVSRGLGTAEVGGLFGLMLIGGAAGKFVCGWLTDVVGQRVVIIITEVLMAAGIVGLLWVGNVAFLAIYLVALGAVLNGTSSAVLAGVADTVDRAPGSRGYGTYFTSTFAGAALAPAAYGVLADRGGLAAVFWGLGLVTLLIPVLASALPRR
jgi:MFS family permease